MFPSDAKILIVDDSVFSRNMLKSSLHELNYWKILEAAEAKSAQMLLLENEQAVDPIHLLIADIHMPEVNGLELVRWLRSRDRTKNLPVIMLTGSQEKDEILAAGKLGVSHYLVKPYDTAILKDRILSTWKKHGQKYLDMIKQ